jgi:hypothetical protein
LAFLGACSQAGDLGRPQRFGAAEFAILPDTGPAYTAGVSASSFPLTDDERQLRALGQNLLNPPFDPGWPHGLPGAGPVRELGGSEAYVRYLVEGPYRSAAARYARLIDDTRNDLVRADPFFTLARRVADLDHKRERSLVYVSTLTQGELTHAHRRVRENMMLMSEVHGSLQERAAMYRLALERLVIALPSPMAVEAERMRTEFERRLAAIQVVAPAPDPAAARAPAVLGRQR